MFSGEQLYSFVRLKSECNTPHSSFPATMSNGYHLARSNRYMGTGSIESSHIIPVRQTSIISGRSVITSALTLLFLPTTATDYLPVAYHIFRSK